MVGKALYIWLLTVLLMALLGGCAKANLAREQSLYLRLGGAEGVQTIVDNLLYEIGDNDQLLPLFEKANVDRFRLKLTEQLCEISDGPCVYSGDDMTEVHAGMAITNRHFDMLVSAFMAAMDAAGVDTGAQNDLLQRLASLHGAVMSDVKGAHSSP